VGSKIINQEIAVVASSRPQEIGKNKKQVKTSRRRRLDDSHHFENKSSKHPEGRNKSSTADSRCVSQRVRAPSLGVSLRVFD
jgi:hypothetical protein